MEIKVEHDKPMPDNSVGIRGKYPWSQMKVGDSFFVAVEGDASLIRLRMNALSSGRSWAKYNGGTARFGSRTVAGSVRIWRVQ